MRLFLCSLLVFGALLGNAHFALSAVDFKTFLTPSKKEVLPQAPADSPMDIITYASKLSQRLYDFRNRPEGGIETRRIRRQLARLSRKTKKIAIEVAFFKSTNHLNYNHLLFFRTNLLRIDRTVSKIHKSLSYTIRGLIRERDTWLKEKENLTKWRASIGKMGPQSIEWRTYQNAEAAIREALRLYDKRLEPLLKTEEEIARLQGKLHELFFETDRWVREIKGNIFERNGPPFFSRAFFAQFNEALWQTTWREIRSFVFQQGEHALDNLWILIEIVVFTFLLTLLIHRSGRDLEETSRWRLFAKKPVSSSLFFCLSVFQILVYPLPPGWQPVFQFLIVVAVILLSKGIFKDVWKWHVLYRFAVLILIVSMFRMIIVPKPLTRIVAFAIAAVGISFCLWESCHRRHKGEAPLLVLSLRLSFGVMVVVLLAEIVGYANFSLYLLNAFLMTVFAVLEIWMVYLMSLGFIELILQKLPLPILRRNAGVILSRIRPLLGVFFVGLFIVSILVIWQVYTTEEEALHHLMTLGFTFGDVKVTVSLLVAAAIVLYGALLVSWGVQALLLQEILPRRGITRGVQLSISRLIHYGIVFAGFLLMLRTLGFGLTNLTIIGGALGVGIGFGLQAIVNNFASGLILLFERPIKIGDTIQIGGEMAVVKRLGLRSTVVQTLDNAEIVIPNSDLVTQQVTNWTLANRLVRVRITVGVAYGSDIEKVRQILLVCAEENPKVLKHPAPQALFLGFGESALNFELRVWISEFMDSTGEVQSALNSAINERFSRSGIEIPFPQTDLHLRSVDEVAARSLRGEGGTSQGSSEK